jgi:hypothetical protein
MSAAEDDAADLGAGLVARVLEKEQWSQLEWSSVDYFTA